MKHLPKGLSITPFKTNTIARLYNTNIVEIDHNNSTITLNSGGWLTKHTKKCINIVLDKFDLSIYQEKFQWYVVGAGTRIEFIDGIKINVMASIDGLKVS